MELLDNGELRPTPSRPNSTFVPATDHRYPHMDWAECHPMLLGRRWDVGDASWPTMEHERGDLHCHDSPITVYSPILGLETP